MTILFITESPRRALALDNLNLRYISVRSDIDENLLPTCVPGLSDLGQEIPAMRVNQFVEWYEEVLPRTNNWSNKLWGGQGVDFCILKDFPARLVLNTYSTIQLKDRIIGKVKSASDLRDLLFCIRDEGTVLLKSYIHIYDLLSRKHHTGSSTTTVTFRLDIEDSFIEDYINTCEGFEGDGSFLLNGRALFLIQSIYGPPLSIMGFPVMEFHRAMREFGITLRDISIR